MIYDLPLDATPLVLMGTKTEKEGPVVSTGFIRFGRLPTGGKSINHLTGGQEKGVSVYEAIVIAEKIRLLFPNLTYSACVSLSGVLDRQAYWVTGRLVGYGSDGEPLLADCLITSEVKSYFIGEEIDHAEYFYHH